MGCIRSLFSHSDNLTIQRKNRELHIAEKQELGQKKTPSMATFLIYEKKTQFPYAKYTDHIIGLTVCRLTKEAHTISMPAQ